MAKEWIWEANRLMGGYMQMRRAGLWTILSLGFGFALGVAQETQQICEAKPKVACLDRTVLNKDTLHVPESVIGLARDGFNICDSSYLYTSTPDLVLIMDNTRSMTKEMVFKNIARYCPTPENWPEDPGCVSGDPDTLRDDAFREFLDSAQVKGGMGTRVAVILFNSLVTYSSQNFMELSPNSLPAIKNEISTELSYGATNYYAALQKATDLLKTSTKARSEQAIIFVSDGRPNLPDPDPYLYKSLLPKLPPVHSIFLGEGEVNYKDLKDISVATGGLFFAIRDVKKMASVLTDSVAKQIFKRALPTQSTVTNLSTQQGFTLGAEGHIPNADSTRYRLALPGPLFLEKGINPIAIKTRYGSGIASQGLTLNLVRDGKADADSLLQISCRDFATLTLYNHLNEDISTVQRPYEITDSIARYTLRTDANADSLTVGFEVRPLNALSGDNETIRHRGGDTLAGVYKGSLPFSHLTNDGKSKNGILETREGDWLIVTYRNPYLPPDSAQVKVPLKFGPLLKAAVFYDENGDGRIETIRIQYAEVLKETPLRYAFLLKNAEGKTETRPVSLASGEIAKDPANKDGSAFLITLKNPFPYGLTDVAVPDSSGRTFSQWNIPMVDGYFKVVDSVSPVIIKATLLESSRSDPLKRVEVVFSENITLEDPAIEPLLFKRDTLKYLRAQIPIVKIEKKDSRTYIFHIAADAAVNLVGGDSVAVAIEGEIKDIKGNAPKRVLYFTLAGATPIQRIERFGFTFANGSSDYPDKNPPTLGNDIRDAFIHLAKNDLPLPGPGRCNSCPGKSESGYPGSVIFFETPGPVTYSFSIFSNLGDFVVQEVGELTRDDLSKLEKIGKETERYFHRVVWTGRTKKGGMAGNGVYVLKAHFQFPKNLQSGAPAREESRLIRFGFLRACCENTEDLFGF